MDPLYLDTPTKKSAHLPTSSRLSALTHSLRDTLPHASDSSPCLKGLHAPSHSVCEHMASRSMLLCLVQLHVQSLVQLRWKLRVNSCGVSKRQDLDLVAQNSRFEPSSCDPRSPVDFSAHYVVAHPEIVLGFPNELTVRPGLMYRGSNPLPNPPNWAYESVDKEVLGQHGSVGLSLSRDRRYALDSRAG